MRRQDHTGRNLRRGKGVQENNRRRVGDVEIDVVERRIIKQTIAAAEDGLAVPGDGPAPVWCVRKANAWTKTLVWGIQVGRGALRKWNIQTRVLVQALALR